MTREEAEQVVEIYSELEKIVSRLQSGFDTYNKAYARMHAECNGDLERTPVEREIDEQDVRCWGRWMKEALGQLGVVDNYQKFMDEITKKEK